MRTFLFEEKQWLPRAIDEVFAFFSRAENLQELTPPWLNFKILKSPDQLTAGALIEYKLQIHGLPAHWKTEITRWNPPNSFEDRQLSGPYALWNHEHLFASHNSGTTVTDRVTYALPFGLLGLVALPLVKRDVKQIFAYRTRRLKELFPQ
jgi:hypothetical protein